MSLEMGAISQGLRQGASWTAEITMRIAVVRVV